MSKKGMQLYRLKLRLTANAARERKVSYSVIYCMTSFANNAGGASYQVHRGRELVDLSGWPDHGLR